MIVYLVPAGRNRFELYSESADEPQPRSGAPEGRLRGWAHRAGARWHELVESARRGGSRGRVARWRDALVCRLAESIAEQRTLWALRHCRTATARVPSSLSQEAAAARLVALLGRARTHHLRWLVIDSFLLAASGLLALLPGPNIIAYYFMFRLVGHVQSWRGARQAMDVIEWTYVADAGLAELAALVDLPREARAPRVAAIAARLNLARLSAFFDRVAVPST